MKTYQDLFDYFEKGLNGIEYFGMEMALDLFFIYCNHRSPYGAEYLAKYLTECSDSCPVISLMKNHDLEAVEKCLELMVSELSKSSNAEVREKLSLVEEDNLPVYKRAMSQIIKFLIDENGNFRPFVSQIAIPLEEDDTNSISIYDKMTKLNGKEYKTC